MTESTDQSVLSHISEAAQSFRETALHGAKQLVGVLALTAAFGATTAAARPLSPENPATAEPHLAIGAEDDAVVASANPNLINTATTQAHDIGAAVMRDIIYPRYVFGRELATYDPAVSSEIRDGFYTTLTLACNKENWTNSKFNRFVTTVVKHFDPMGVREYSICNEPNFPGWMNRLPGKTRPETYSDLYSVGYAAIKKQAQEDGVNDRVVFGEISSEFQPLKFIKQVLNVAPVKTDMMSYHPYTLTASPLEPCDLSGDVGFACLPVIEKLVQHEYDVGRLETPGGQKPGLGLSEFAYQVETPTSTATPVHGGHHTKGPARQQSTSRNIPDKVRQQYYYHDLEIACNDPNVVRLGFYQLVLLPGAKGPWRSPLFTPKGQPYGSARVIQAFADNHPCVR